MVLPMLDSSNIDDKPEDKKQKKWLTPVASLAGLVAVSVLLFVQECNKDARTILKKHNNLELIDSTQTRVNQTIRDSAEY